MSNKLNTRIGILGGGQLGKMLMESCSSLNLSYNYLERSKDCPAYLVNPNIVEGSLYDRHAIIELAGRSDVLTYEIEHVNIEVLAELQERCPSIPYPSVLQVIQDKGAQKDFYRNNGVPTLPFLICNANELRSGVQRFGEERFVLKHRKGGYDGKGVQLLSVAEFEAMLDRADPLLGSTEGYVIEKLAEAAREISVIVAVGQNGDIRTYETSEMVFDPKANLMDYLISPASLTDDTKERCREVALKAVAAFRSPGIFAVELFVDSLEEVYVNEIAPRPHNSGHHTIESCYTSQYEQLNRILLNLPLGSTDMLSAALTANILGPEGLDGRHYLDGLDRVLDIPGVYVHMYGKTITKPYRKLGHFTVLGRDTEECVNKMKLVRKHLTIAPLD